MPSLAGQDTANRGKLPLHSRHGRGRGQLQHDFEPRRARRALAPAEPAEHRDRAQEREGDPEAGVDGHLCGLGGGMRIRGEGEGVGGDEGEGEGGGLGPLRELGVDDSGKMFLSF